MEQITYQDLKVSPDILRAVKQMGFTEMTEIQQKAIPVMLEGRDIIAKAPTGTGKTCAFGIPIIEKINPDNAWPQALILCPTRELCTQICEEIRRLAIFKPGIHIASIYGGQSMGRQIDQLKKGVHVVVATPGRLLDHMNHRTIRLDKVSIAVLDEADRMLDMGFFKDVRKILDRLPARQQLVMFSATISREVMDIGWIYQRDSVELTVKPVEESQPKITQYSLESQGGRQKLEDIISILQQRQYKRAIFFCNTKYTTSMLGNQLSLQGYNADCLNGDMRQSERNKIMARFRSGELNYLVATDVAARGIDVSDVEAVFNYDMPQDNDSYLHRIGRTGRAKKEGISYLFYNSEERSRLSNIIRYTHSNIIPLSFDENRQLVELPEESE